jgi:hypothetical protein
VVIEMCVKFPGGRIRMQVTDTDIHIYLRMYYVEQKWILRVGFIKRGSPPEGEPLLEAGGGSWKWVILG